MYFSFFLENEIALPLDKGGNLQKVPLIKGDLGGSHTDNATSQTSSKKIASFLSLGKSINTLTEIKDVDKSKISNQLASISSDNLNLGRRKTDLYSKSIS